MKKLLTYHLYIIGFILLTAFTVYLNWNCPPNYDEAHAWNLARFLSPLEIFSIGKFEGHPFLWYYILMPFAKTNFFYPYSLYTINILFILSAFYCLYRYAPLPTYLKYLITLSAPFLKLYSSFARSYSVSIFLSFLVLSLYPKRIQKTPIYLTLLFLLANTNVIGFMIAAIFGLMFFLDITNDYKQNKCSIGPLYQTITLALVELILVITQFGNYDKEITSHTPVFHSLKKDLNIAFAPMNIYLYGFLSTLILYFLLKNKKYKASAFLGLMCIGLTLLFRFIYHGNLHHYYFYYISLIIAYWLAYLENNTKLPIITLIPLTVISFSFIFIPNYLAQIKEKTYLTEIYKSAYALNKTFPQEHIEIYTPLHFEANIMLPYLNENITLRNQNMTDFRDIQSVKEALIHLYMPINSVTAMKYIQKNPNIHILERCGEPISSNTELAFHLKYKLSKEYCLYSILKR